MREAGFSGSSRNLKALRDETIFINQLVASVESVHGIGIASLVLYHIFGKIVRSSNIDIKLKGHRIIKLPPNSTHESIC
jgi:hypothetical protein